jgi:long-chain acyl-CoA synthetase
MSRRSVAEYLDDFLARGDDPAYVQPAGYRTERWSYRRVAETAFQFAHELEDCGIGKGERVMLWGPNSAQWVAAFLGCALRGVIAVPMDDTATADFASRVARQVDAKLLVASAQHRGSVELQTLSLEELSASSVRPPAIAIDPQDTLEIVFTSGTTAEPKGVVISHGNVLANIAPLETEIRKYLKYERWFHPVRFLNLLPLSHVFGQFLGIFLPQIMGGTVVFETSLKPSEILATVKRENISVIVSVPRILQSLKEKIERDAEAAGGRAKFTKIFASAEGKKFLRRAWIFRRIHRKFGLKFWAFISGGAALDSVTEEFWGRLGYAVIQGYGLTETTSLISLNHPFRLGKGSIGKVMPGREVKLGPEGEILVRGAGVASGYWGQQSGEQGDWYATGDIGELDASGNLYFKGRKKDVIVTPAGMNVYPEDLEAALRCQPEVKDCVVVALPKDGNAEACAVIILRGDADAATVVKQANQNLAEFQQIRHWFAWPQEDFPRTSTQKPRRNEILQEVLQQKAPTAQSGLADLIARSTGRTAEGLSQSSDLEADLSLSSLDRVELIGAIEDRYQVELNETKFAAVRTVGDLEALLLGERPAKTTYTYPAWVQRWPVTWIRNAVHYTMLFPAVHILGLPQILGRENLKGVRGPVLVVSNHISDEDVGFILTALPSHLRTRVAIATGGEALQALRTPDPARNILLRLVDPIVWTFAVSLLNLFPLPRQAGFRDSFAYAGDSVDRGFSILVFPEGRHTIDGQLLPFRSGVGLLANNLKVPIVPMRIDGIFELKSAHRRVSVPGQIQIRIGQAVQFPSHTDPVEIAVRIEEIVRNL